VARFLGFLSPVGLRWLNIVVRSIHLGTSGILVGGHAFEVPAERLVPTLVGAIASGALLTLLESGGRSLWLHQGRGLLTMAKLLVLCLVPIFWAHRLILLWGVILLGGIGSHMPAFLRYYSLLWRKVVPVEGLPGAGQLISENLAQMGEEDPRA